MMKKIKLVIWDADNTLWDGTVFYKDKESIKIKPGTKEALKELDKRNIKSTICSRNYYEDAESMLKKFEIEKSFNTLPIIVANFGSIRTSSSFKTGNLSFANVHIS